MNSQEETRQQLLQQLLDPTKTDCEVQRIEQKLKILTGLKS